MQNHVYVYHAATTLVNKTQKLSPCYMSSAINCLEYTLHVYHFYNYAIISVNGHMLQYMGLYGILLQDKARNGQSGPFAKSLKYAIC